MRRGQRNERLISPPLAASGVMTQKKWDAGPRTHPALVSSHLLQCFLSSNTCCSPISTCLSGEARQEIRAALGAGGWQSRSKKKDDRAMLFMATQLSFSRFAAGACHINKGRRMSRGHDLKGRQPSCAQPPSRCSSSHQSLPFPGYLHPPPKRD